MEKSMKSLHKIVKRFLGSDGENADQLEKKRKEAVAIKHGMNNNIIRIKKKVDALNATTTSRLAEISADLDSVTYHIAIATGAKRRGLK